MKKIALGLALSDYYDHGIARGIVRYARMKPGWQLFGHGWMFSPLEDLTSWRGDGVITRIESPREIGVMKDLPCPVIDVANGSRTEGIHRVYNNDIATGTIAGKHFIENGFRSFAYCGISDGQWSQERRQGFLKAISAVAEPRETPIFERPLEWWLKEPYSFELALFLARLPKPTGLFACNDKAGLRVSITCASQGIAVPEDIAILGVDNEEIPCELANPSMSSIELQLERIGYSAARVLDNLISAKASSGPEPRPAPGADTDITIDPFQVIERRSTAIYASEDPLVGDVFRVIRSEEGHTRSVSEIASELAVGRRTMEKHFREETGRTVHGAIVEQRVRVAAHLLKTTQLKTEAVAREAGFGSMQRFFAHFRQHLGVTPHQYRSR
ncbi:LacI family transcriptional regulator [Alkalispirochaeta americana]|uniref:LacI family transcriptional regulator n=1 Tax=Alkalispirochaeta americana TaxID=159291 RepID=A0A1N6TI25_9SPIO|nr:xylose operon transcription regulator XylR [Alkalispirochaeta americana]SIQ53032.1 LacI family transcriptional regulator [Alkalispirochaeta americana]